MNWRNTPDRYGSLMRGIHWLMLLLLIAVYVTINLHDLAPKGSGLRADLKVWHFMLGLCVFVLLIARLGTRLSSGVTPRITPPLSRWMKRSSDAMHILLYILSLIHI